MSYYSIGVDRAISARSFMSGSIESIELGYALPRGPESATVTGFKHGSARPGRANVICSCGHAARLDLLSYNSDARAHIYYVNRCFISDLCVKIKFHNLSIYLV